MSRHIYIIPAIQRGQNVNDKSTLYVHDNIQLQIALTTKDQGLVVDLVSMTERNGNPEMVGIQSMTLAEYEQLCAELTHMLIRFKQHLTPGIAKVH